MTQHEKSYPSSRVVVPVAVAVIAIVAGCASGPKPTLAPQALAEMRQTSVDVYNQAQVTKAVAQARGNMGPEYPVVLKTERIEGVVVLAFVVDTTGRIDMNSATVVKSTDQRFLDAVVAVLPGQRFIPAQLDGRKVKQLVSEPFYFQNTDSTKAHGPQTIDQAVKTLRGGPVALPIAP
jgi:TonB family protein